jgi:hypothetical protein
MVINLFVKGTGKDIELKDANIKECTFFSESPDSANARSTDVSNTLVIKGKLFSMMHEGEKDDSIELAKWASIKAENPDSYCAICIEMWDADILVRKITFPNAFVVDYREDYFDTVGGGTFELKVRQKKDKAEKIIIEKG